MVVHAYNPSYLEVRGRRVISLMTDWMGKNVKILKNEEWAECVAQVVDHLSSKYKPLNSVPSTVTPQ
jgi:hypothetical protein